MNKRLLDVKAVAEACGLSVRSVWRMADAGKMPRPVAIGRARRWRADELDAWVQGGCKPCDPRRTSGRVAR